MTHKVRKAFEEAVGHQRVAVPRMVTRFATFEDKWSDAIDELDMMVKEVQEYSKDPDMPPFLWDGEDDDYQKMEKKMAMDLAHGLYDVCQMLRRLNEKRDQAELADLNHFKVVVKRLEAVANLID